MLETRKKIQTITEMAKRRIKLMVSIDCMRMEAILVLVLVLVLEFYVQLD